MMEQPEISALPEDMSKFELVGIVRIPQDFSSKRLRRVDWEEIDNAPVSFDDDVHSYELSRHELQNAFRLNLVDPCKKVVRRLDAEAKMYRVIKKPNRNS